ncbi:MAG: UDP-N-acetylmuramoyl-tripeptide--D-alanyl-D-alanine ligase [Tunicatimonas sp.]|uniref:UDP-N-acetylmuramoyl-tripeptide--D-alanyl-D- alanine ligase n=1 Tax=Tunicatimonas sp. TaxID=1940096 RepID=UPI003C7197B3
MKTTEELYNIFLRCGKVSTDTRRIDPASMFFALKGANFNGNKFAGEAVGKGAAYAVIDETEFQQDERFLLVDDVLTSLQNLAHHHRKQLDMPVIGINGTNGKTTTKELLHAVLSQKYETLATKGNLNNHIGVPLTLLELSEDTEMAIIELGANAVGEIATLCQIAHPTYGLTTNIGKAHMEGFGGLEGAIRGESEQYDYMRKTNGTVFINSQNPLLSNMAKRFEQPYLYPAANDYFHCEFISADPFVRYRHEDGQKIETQLLGGYNFENIAAALCIGKFFGVPAKQANQAVADYQPSNKRSQIVKKDSNTIILDAYNANPDSMQAAIENLKAMQATQKVVILGDMYELGEDSPQEHRAIGEQLASAGFTQVFLCGELMHDAAETYPEAHYFPQKADLESFLKENPVQDSTILLKASRGIALESLVDLL